MVIHYDILYVCLEFKKWNLARPWTYPANLGLEEGFKYNNLNYFTLTTPLLNHAKELCKGKTFSQVWIEIVHQEFDNEFLQWLKEIAPFRIGLIFESLEIDKINSNDIDSLIKRKNNVIIKSNYLTHSICVDEIDVNFFNNDLKIPSFWWPSCVPLNYIQKNQKKLKNKKAVFSGTLYGERLKLIESVNSLDIVENKQSSDVYNFYHVLFDLIHLILDFFLKLRLYKIYNIYIRLIRFIRKKNFNIYLNFISTYSVVINLPSVLKSYPGRVIEAMAVKSVVVTNHINDRPLNQKLFKNEKDIIFYDSKNKDDFKSKLLELLNDDKKMSEISNNALNNLIENHTVENRIHQVLDWLNK